MWLGKASVNERGRYTYVTSYFIVQVLSEPCIANGPCSDTRLPRRQLSTLSYVDISFKSIEFNNPFALTWPTCPLCVALMIFTGFRDMLSKDPVSLPMEHLFLLYWHEGHTKKPGGTNQFLVVWYHTWTGLPHMVTRIRNTEISQLKFFVFLNLLKAAQHRHNIQC